MSKEYKIGVALKFPTQKEKYTTTKRGCGDHATNSTDKFCKECGKEIKDFEIEQEQVLWCDDLIGNERFASHTIDGEIDIDYFFSNHNYGQLDIEEYDYKAIELTEELRSAEIEKFKEFHKEDIQNGDRLLLFELLELMNHLK